MSIGINDAGHRTVIQWPNGTTWVKFKPGIYLQMFGSKWVYNDVLTVDFDKTINEQGATVDQDGIAVRYQDGGTGTVFGIARYRLPSDEATMLKAHKEFRSNEGIGFKVLKPTTEDIMNHTAGLMTSEESYAERRGTFKEWSKDQLRNGMYLTRQKPVTEIEYGYEFCLEDDLSEELEKECKGVKKTTKMVPVIVYRDNKPAYSSSDLGEYGIELTGFNIVDWSYEQKTLDQISEKRKAQMAIITAKANAERAKQDAITAEQVGIANVTVAKYEKEVEKERAVVDAERVKEVAVIEAEKKVDVAEQYKLEQEQLKFAAAEYKQAQTLKGDGDAYYKRAVIEADGALVQKLETYQAVMGRFATEFGKQKWVPEVQMGGYSADGTTPETGSAATDLINMLNVRVAKDLALDMSVKP
jgi:hypothetical protein